MKKSIIIIGIIACAALMVSCNKTDKAPQSKQQGHPMTLTLSIEDVSTKTTLSVDAGVYHRVWKAGDNISVIYSVAGVPKNERFTLTDGAGTATGTFACPNSELTGTQYDIHFLYPYTSQEWSSSWWKVDISEQYYGVIDYGYLGGYDIMWGYGYYKDDAFTMTSPLTSMVYYLHIPKSTTIVSGSSGDLTVSLTLAADGSTELHNERLVSKTLSSTSHNEGNIVLKWVDLTDGALQNDVYIATMSDNVANETFTLTVKDDSSNQCTYNIGRGADKYLYNGQVYHLSQTNFTPTLALE